jgi:hypothetical protein
MWTVARDVLTELQRLGCASVGILPRKLSSVDRLRETPCEIRPQGRELARIHAEKPGQAYNQLLIAWMNEHPYFRSFTIRTLRGPLYVPDITTVKQLGDCAGSRRSLDSLQASATASCARRLEAASIAADKIASLKLGIEKRLAAIGGAFLSPEADAKRIVDLVEDSAVVPAFLEMEGLSLDPVTFQHVLRCGGEFYSAAWTSSHPDFTGRVVFATCGFKPDLLEDAGAAAAEVVHHGHAYAQPRFAEVLASAYRRITGTSGAYTDAYGVRALVCLELRIQPPVFAACLESMVAAGSSGNPVVYTELPFAPPPPGEGYVEVGQRRVGRLKLSFRNGA